MAFVLLLPHSQYTSGEGAIMVKNGPTLRIHDPYREEKMAAIVEALSGCGDILKSMNGKLP